MHGRPSEMVGGRHSVVGLQSSRSRGAMSNRGFSNPNSTPPGLGSPNGLLGHPSGMSSRNPSGRLNPRGQPKASPHPADRARNALTNHGDQSPNVQISTSDQPVQAQDSNPSIASNSVSHQMSRNSKICPVRKKGSSKSIIGLGQQKEESCEEKRDASGSDKNGVGTKPPDTSGSKGSGTKGGKGNDRQRDITVELKPEVGLDDLEAGRAGGGAVEEGRVAERALSSADKQGVGNYGPAQAQSGSASVAKLRSGSVSVAAKMRSDSASVAHAISKSEVDHIGYDV